MKNLNQQEPENNEKAEFFEMYPLPKGFETKADKAWELKQIVSTIYNDNEKSKKLVDFANKIIEEYPDATKCYLWQVIIGGSREITTRFDYEDEYSIEKFLMTFKV